MIDSGVKFGLIEIMKELVHISKINMLWVRRVKFTNISCGRGGKNFALILSIFWPVNDLRLCESE